MHLSIEPTMLQSVASIFVAVLGIYFLIGLLFAIPFVVTGIVKIDHAAQNTSWRFRLLMIPGSMAFWPILLRKWIAAKKGIS